MTRVWIVHSIEPGTREVTFVACSSAERAEAERQRWVDPSNGFVVGVSVLDIDPPSNDSCLLLDHPFGNINVTAACEDDGA